MLNFMKRMLNEDSAQDLAEYGIALAVIAAAVALIAVAVGTDVQTLWSNGQAVIADAAAN